MLRVELVVLREMMREERNEGAVEIGKERMGRDVESGKGGNERKNKKVRREDEWDREREKERRERTEHTGKGER